jgi:hypothetical protein
MVKITIHRNIDNLIVDMNNSRSLEEMSFFLFRATDLISKWRWESKKIDEDEQYRLFFLLQDTLDSWSSTMEIDAEDLKNQLQKKLDDAAEKETNVMIERLNRRIDRKIEIETRQSDLSFFFRRNR